MAGVSVFRARLGGPAMVWARGHKIQGGKYVIRETLGEGGFGVTYRAYHTLLEQQLVIKTPNDKLRKEPDYEKYVEKFIGEARVLARLSQKRHPHIVAVQDVCFEACFGTKLPCLVMEYVQGQNLFDVVLTQGPLSEKAAVAYIRQIGDALRVVHGEGLVHRDAHPGNMMLTDRRQAMLIDFGLAREVMPNASTQSLNVAFAPWEQMTGVVGPTLDIYTVAASLYFLVTGQPPTPCLNRKMMNQKLVDPRQHVLQLSGWLNKAIVRGMALEPEQRPQTMAEFLQLLNAPIPQPQPPQSPSPRNSPPPQQPRRDEPPFVQPPAPANGLNLVRFGFKTVRMDERGQITERETRSAEQFIEDLGNGVVLEMVYIPGGEFWMGAADGEESASSDERPRHRVQVPEFCLGKYAVTQAQYEAVRGGNPSRFKGEKRPVKSVSWNDAQEFCKKLSEQTGRAYRLPSEAEWEYACRAGTTTPFYFGETITSGHVNYDGTCTYGKGSRGQFREQTTEVGSFLPNGFGLYDMHGNVWEWCADRWHGSYNGAPTDGSAWMTGDQELYVLRGGSWFGGPGYCRSARRNGNAPPGLRLNDFGFRVVWAAPRT